MEKSHPQKKINKHLSLAKHWKLWSTIGIILFIAFVIFTFIVRADLLTSFDFNTTVRIQDDIPLRFDYFFSILSVVGRFEYTVILLILLLIIKRKFFGIIPLFLFGFAHVIELIGKTILNHPGPPHMFLRSQFGDFPGLHVFTDASYPSGHSLRAVFLSIVIIYFVSKIKQIPTGIKYLFSFGILTLLFFVLLSRVSLGEHWTTDVVGGSLLGSSFAFLSLIFL